MATDEEPTEQTEPTNKQLARFLEIVAHHTAGAENLRVSAEILEHILDQDPRYRLVALKKHREFTEKMQRSHEKMERGQLQCSHIRPNGKNCPNWNEPGSYYCGLHKDEHEDDVEIEF